jgi:hypothetical protein
MENVSLSCWRVTQMILGTMLLTSPQIAMTRGRDVLAESTAQLMARLGSAGICSEIRRDHNFPACKLALARDTWVVTYFPRAANKPFMGLELEVPLASDDPRVPKSERSRATMTTRRLLRYLFPEWRGGDAWFRRGIAFAESQDGFTDLPIMATRVRGYVVLMHRQPKMDMNAVFYDLVICRPEAVHYYAGAFVLPARY